MSNTDREPTPEWFQALQRANEAPRGPGPTEVRHRAQVAEEQARKARIEREVALEQAEQDARGVLG